MRLFLVSIESEKNTCIPASMWRNRRSEGALVTLFLPLSSPGEVCPCLDAPVVAACEATRLAREADERQRSDEKNKEGLSCQPFLSPYYEEDLSLRIDRSSTQAVSVLDLCACAFLGEPSGVCTAAIASIVGLYSTLAVLFRRDASPQCSGNSFSKAAIHISLDEKRKKRIFLFSSSFLFESVYGACACLRLHAHR